MKTRRRSANYATAVIDALTNEFSDLTDPTTAENAAKVIADHVAEPRATFEYILDLPAANWRLRSHRSSSRVRLACYHLNPAPTDDERERRINKVLDQIPI